MNSTPEIRSTTAFSVIPPEGRDEFARSLGDLMGKICDPSATWEIYYRGSNSVALELLINTSDPEVAESLTDNTVRSILDNFDTSGSGRDRGRVKRGSNKLAPA